ncbi:MAG: hypothetical protein ACOC2M_03770, partial [bacterium]
MKQRLIILFSFFLLAGILEYVYIEYVSVSFQYLQFYYEPNFLKFFEAKVFLVVLSFIIPKNINKPSDIIYLWFIIFPIVPLASIYWLKDEARLFFYFVITCVFLLRYLKEIKTFKIKKIKQNNYYGLFVSIFFTLIGISWFFASGAINNFNLNFAKVYEFRREVGRTLSFGILGYLSAWAYNVFSIYLLTYFFYKKKIFFVALMLLLQVFYFGVTSHKSVLFYPILILGFYYIFNKYKGISRLVNSLNILLLLFVILVIYTDFDFILSLGFRRAFFTTSRMHFDYYSIFSELGHIYMS